MKTIHKLLIMAVAILAFTAISPPKAQAQMGAGNVSSTSVFFEPLAPHGDWYYTQQYGWVWSPYMASAAWQPYQAGHWVYTNDYGYMWVSEEPWAWATYHYGRWTWLDGVWIWIPDTTWGPAWVAWSHTSTHVGWAPLPPGVAMGGYGTVNVNVNISWRHWMYVPGTRLLTVNLMPYYIPRNQVQVIYYRATPSTRYSYHRGAVLCLGPSTLYVTRWLGRPPPPVRVSYASTPPHSYYAGGTVYVYRTPPPPSRAYSSAPPPPQRATPRGMSPYVSRPPAPHAAYRSQPASPPVTGRGTPPAPNSTYRGGAPSSGTRSTPPAPASGTRSTPPAPISGTRSSAPPPTSSSPRYGSGSQPSGSKAPPPPAPRGKGLTTAPTKRVTTPAATKGYTTPKRTQYGSAQSRTSAPTQKKATTAYRAPTQKKATTAYRAPTQKKQVPAKRAPSPKVKSSKGKIR